MVICVEKVTKQCKYMPKWKIPGKEDVQGYWIMNFNNLHERVAIETNKIFLMGDDSLPACITSVCNVLSQEDPRKVNTVEN